MAPNHEKIEARLKLENFILAFSRIEWSAMNPLCLCCISCDSYVNLSNEMFVSMMVRAASVVMNTIIHSAMHARTPI